MNHLIGGIRIPKVIPELYYWNKYSEYLSEQNGWTTALVATFRA